MALLEDIVKAHEQEEIKINDPKNMIILQQW